MRSVHKVVVATCWLAIVALRPAVLLAGEAAPGNQDITKTAPVEKSPDAAGCAHSDTGSCCIPSEENAAPAPNVEPAPPADCPCQHAKQAGEDS